MPHIFNVRASSLCTKQPVNSEKRGTGRERRTDKMAFNYQTVNAGLPLLSRSSGGQVRCLISDNVDC